MRLRARLGLLLLVAALLGADEPIRPKNVQFAERGGFLAITLELPELVDDALRKRLRKGLASTIVLRAYLYREGQDLAVGFTPRTYYVAYDLWDFVYQVKTVDLQGERTQLFRTEKEAVDAISKLDTFLLARLESIPPGQRHFVAIRIEVNPVSPELLAQERRWLKRGNDGARAGGGESFLGSFMSFFVNAKVEAAERVLKFRSQPFYRPEPKRDAVQQ